jgi:hypothetical protein
MLIMTSTETGVLSGPPGGVSFTHAAFTTATAVSAGCDPPAWRRKIIAQINR